MFDSIVTQFLSGFGIVAILVKGGSGVFDVVADGNLLFSKKQVGRFPTESEVLDQLPKSG